LGYVWTSVTRFACKKICWPRDRLYSVHFKDLDSDRVDAKGLRVATGVMPIVELLRDLVRERYSGEVLLDCEVEENPLPRMAESLGFMRGVLQAM